MNPSNTAKAAELQILLWFLEAGWEVFSPVDDRHGVDFVLRFPDDRKLVAIQVKHKQPGAKNVGQLGNPWAGTEPPFDFLVFYLPEQNRGLVLPKHKLRKQGKQFLFFKEASDGYHSGPVRPLYSDFGFDFGTVPHEQRAQLFVSHFSTIYRLGANSPTAGPAEDHLQTSPDLLQRAQQIWGSSPSGAALSELVAAGRT